MIPWVRSGPGGMPPRWKGASGTGAVRLYPDPGAAGRHGRQACAWLPGCAPGSAPPAPGDCLGAGQPSGPGPAGGGTPLPRDYGHVGVAADAGSGRWYGDAESGTPWVEVPDADRATDPGPGSRLCPGRQGEPAGPPARLQDTFACAQTQGFVDGPHDDVETVHKDHGRVETRRCGTIEALDYCRYVDPHQVWAALQSLVMVESERRCR